MPRPKSLTMTDGELRLMRVLWDKGEATVGEVVDALKARPKPAYNTVLTLLRIMEKKGYVRIAKNGRAFIFLRRSTAPMRAAAAAHARDRFFDGSRACSFESARGCAAVPEALKQLEDRIEEA